MSDSIKVSIELADKVAQKSLTDFIANADKADKSLKKLGSSGHDTFNDISVEIGKSLGVYDIFAGNLAANLVTKGFEVMKEAATELFNVFIVEGVKAAEEAESALNSLNTALAQSGHYSEQTSKELTDFAKTIQQTTAFEDDLVIQNIALLESLTQLDKNGLQRASKAAIELSSALGRDLASTTEAVAKASNGNYTVLQKMGIQFDKSGSQANSFQNALKAIETQFGGAAESKINTFAGAISQTKNNFQDLQEEFGNLIIKNPAIIAAISAVSNVIKDLTESGFFKGVEGTKALGQGFLDVIQIANYTIQFINGVATSVSTAFDLIIVASTTALALLIEPFKAFSTTASDIFDNLVQQSNQSLDKIGERLESGGPLSGVIKTLDAVGAAAQEGFNKIGTGADQSSPKIVNVANSMKKLTEEQKRQLEETNNFVDGLAKKNQSIEENQKLELENLKAFYDQKDVVESDAEIVNYQAKIDRELEFYNQRQLILDQQFSDEQDRVISSTLTEQTKTQALLQIQKKYEADSFKSQTDYFKKKVDFEKASDKESVNQRSQTLNLYSTLASSNNQTLASIGKAAALAQIAIDTPQAVSGAFKWGSTLGGPVLGFTFGAIAAAAEAAQAAKVVGLNFAEGGVVPGSSFSGDNVAANVNSGEMILNRTQQAELFKVANGSGSNNSGLLEEIKNLRVQFTELLSQPISIAVDGKELFNVTRQQLANGRAY